MQLVLLTFLNGFLTFSFLPTRIPDQYKAGVYLIAQAATTKTGFQTVPVSLAEDRTFKTTVERLNASLYFAVYSANPIDKNFTRQAVIGRLDDLDRVRGYHFPATIKDSVGMTPIMGQQHKDRGSNENTELDQMDESEYRKRAGVVRVMKRYTDQSAMCSSGTGETKPVKDLDSLGER